MWLGPVTGICANARSNRAPSRAIASSVGVATARAPEGSPRSARVVSSVRRRTFGPVAGAGVGSVATTAPSTRSTAPGGGSANATTAPRKQQAGNEPRDNRGPPRSRRHPGECRPDDAAQRCGREGVASHRGRGQRDVRGERRSQDHDRTVDQADRHSTGRAPGESSANSAAAHPRAPWLPEGLSW